MLGVCLGAAFEHSPNKEIGVFELTLTELGKQEPIFSTFPEKFQVGHWHGDMPGLTRESKVLATSQGCPHYVGMNELLFKVLDYLAIPAVCSVTMDAIGSKKCVPCEGGVAKLTTEQINILLKPLNGWSLQGNKIQREYQFKDFKRAMVFVNHLAAIAEAEGHHPDFTVHYNVVTVSTWTHSINGLSENDFILASKIDG